MEDNNQNNSNENANEQYVAQKNGVTWNVEIQDLEKIGGYTFDEFVIECSMRLFAAANLDMYGAKNVNIVVKECVDRAMLLAEQLHNRLSNKNSHYWYNYKAKNNIGADICDNFCNTEQNI